MYAVALAVASLATLGPPPLMAEAKPDEESIRAVLEGYVTGWRDGDVKRLATVFAPEEGRILWVTGGPGQESLASMTFAQALRQRRPQAEYGRPWKLLSLDVVDGQLAVAKLDISRTGGSYVDYLVLYKICGAWRIVTKTYVMR